MDLLSRNSMIFKVERNNEEYTCILHKGKKFVDECIENWQSMTIFGPNSRKNIVNFIPKEFEAFILQSRYSVLYDYESSFKNLNDYENKKAICEIGPCLLEVGDSSICKCLVISNLIGSNNSYVMSFDDFMLLCAAHCYFSLKEEYFCKYTKKYKPGRHATHLSNLYINPFASEYDIPVNEDIHWLIIPNFELLFHIYPSEVLALAAYFIVDSNRSAEFESDFGSESKIKSNIQRIADKYDLANCEVILNGVQSHLSVLEQHLPIVCSRTSKSFEESFSAKELIGYFEEIIGYCPDTESDENLKNGVPNDIEKTS